MLNELAETRANLLGHLFPAIALTRLDAAQIDDHLDDDLTPSVVMMNPTHSVISFVSCLIAYAALRHLVSALLLPASPASLVSITGVPFSRSHTTWQHPLATAH